MIRLSQRYIRYFKQQSCYVLLGIIATVAILTAINCAFETNNKMELERAREITGDYHFFYTRLSEEDIQKACSLRAECRIEKTGYMQLGKIYNGYDNSTVIGLKSMDPGYEVMFGMEILEGRYPQKDGEIALEEWVLPYFTEEGIGAQIKLTEDGRTDTYLVTGILKDREGKKGNGQKTGFVASSETEGGYYQLFIKFDESRDVHKLFTEFGDKFGHQEEAASNREILFKLDYKTFNTSYGVDDINLSSSADSGATSSGAGKLFREWLAGVGADKALGTFLVTVFSMIILYSIFRISVQQRIREYGKLEAFGLGTKDIAVLLGSELFILFLIGFPSGTVLGAVLIWGIYQYYRGLGAVDFSVSCLEQLSLKDISVNAGLILLVLLFIVILVTIQLGRMSIIETINGKKEKRKTKRKAKCHGNRIWSRLTDHMMPVVLMKYFLEKKGRVITMILMLALGGTVFLTGSYVEEQIQRENRLTQISDNGTNADIRVAIENQRFTGGISDEQVEKIQSLPEVKLAEPVSFYYGGMLIKKEQIRQSIIDDGFGYWKDQDKWNSVIASVGGHLAEEGEGQYNLKTEFYGYDDEMLRELEDFIVEGSIDSVRQQDTVIWQALMNGGGDWDIVNLHVGDKITVRFPKENPGRITNENYQILSLIPKGEYKDAYEERTFTIGAIVKGGIANNEEFLVGLDISGIIMPNDAFRQCFDVDGSNIVSVQLKDQKTADKAAAEIRSILEGTDGLSVIDYTDEIVRQKEYLEQTMILVRIIVILLLAIGFFNTLSSVNYILLEKKKDFAVMRAMGITDSRLMRAMAGEGLAYGLIMSILMVIISLIIQFPVKYFMDHGFIFINAQYNFNWPLAIGITGLNILLGITAVIFPAKRVLFNEITEELSDMG